MRKYVLLLIGLCLLSAQVDAQVAIATPKELSMISRGVAKSVRKGNPLYIPGKARVGNTGFYSFQVSHVLRRRVLKSFVKARKTRRALASNTDQHFLNPAIHVGNVNPNIYPLIQSVPYLHTNKQARLYLVARENRLYVQQTERLFQERLPKLKESLPRLRDGIYPELPKNPVRFVAKAIPAQVNTIAIGEVHGFENIQQFIARFLPEVRKKYPKREIFLFTEFAPKGSEYIGDDWILLDPRRTDIWQTAAKNRMKIIGLEPKEVLADHSILNVHLGKNSYLLVSTPHGIRRLPFFASANGIKWRNEAFLQTIQEYRAQHPDALFIVYTGDAHVNTRFPFAITQSLGLQETFVISLRPTYDQAKQAYPKYKETEIRCMWNPFEEFNDSEAFDGPLLYWEDPELARLAGANIYLRAEDALISQPGRKSRYRK